MKSVTPLFHCRKYKIQQYKRIVKFKHHVTEIDVKIFVPNGIKIYAEEAFPKQKLYEQNVLNKKIII